MVEKRDGFSSARQQESAGQQSLPSAVTDSGSSPSVVRDPAKKWPTTAQQFDEMFDNGEDIDHLIDWSSARLVHPTKRVNVDFPTPMVVRLDREAKKRGVTRQALIKMWLADRLEGVG